MAFTRPRFFVAASLLGVAGALSLIQQRAEVVTIRAGDPPSLSDVEDQLGKVNDTLDQVSEALDTINSTAYDMMSTFLSSTSDFVEILGTLQKAADAASMLPGGDKISDTATKFITLANDTLAKAQGDLPAILAKVEAEIGPILPAIQKIADSLISEFMDAAQEVLDLTNVTDSSLLKKAKKSKEHVTKADKKHKAPEKDVSKVDKKHKAHKGKHAKDGMALMQERALRSGDMASSAVSVDKSVSQKGSSNPCSKALTDIDKANETIGKMAAKVEEVNATGFELLGQVLEVATGALDTLNSTIAPALDAASAIPSSILSPVTTGLDKVLSVGDTLTSTVTEQLSTVQEMIEDAQSTLSTVYSLSDTLVAAVTEAQCAGACGDKMKDACES